MAVKKNITVGIYRITNIVNGKIYIGSSSALKKRFYEHRRTLRKATHRNPHLQSAWQEYGEANFKFEILQECDAQTLLAVEKEYILTYRCYDREFGYNISIEPSNNQLGMKRSAETRKKIGIAKRGNTNRLGAVVPQEMRDRIASKLRGSKATDAMRALMSAQRKGKPHSKEWSAKIGAANKGKIITQEHRAVLSERTKAWWASKPKKEKKPKKPIGRPPGIPLTEAQKKHLSEINLGKHLTAEHKAKIGAAHRARRIAFTLTGISHEALCQDNES